MCKSNGTIKNIISPLYYVRPVRGNIKHATSLMILKKGSIWRHRLINTPRVSKCVKNDPRSLKIQNIAATKSPLVSK